MPTGSNEQIPYRDLVETAGDAICTIDASGVYLFINSAGAARLGRTAAGVIGTTVWDVFPKATADKQMGILREVMRSGRGTVVETQVEIRGQLRWHRTSIEPLRNAQGTPEAAMVIAADIHDRRMAEEALRLSEQRFREAMDLLPAALMELGMDGRVRYGNCMFHQTSGYTPEDVQAGLEAVQMAHPEDRALASERIARVLAGESLEPTELRIIRKDGREIVALIQSAPIFRDGRPDGLRAAMADITVRNRAEQALRESEELLRQILLHANDGINMVAFDPGTFKRRLVMCSERYVQMSGRTREDLMSREDLDKDNLFTHDSPQLREFYRQKIAQNECCQGWSSWVRPDGKENVFEWTAAPIWVGGRLYVIGIDRDITERLQAEKALRQSEAQYRAVFSSATDAFFILNLDGNVVEANPQASTMYGYSHEELVGAPANGLVPHGQTGRYQEHEFMRRLRRGEEHRMETVDLRKDGSLVHVEVRGRMFEFRGQPHFLVVATDISQRKEAEAALRAANRQLMTAREAERRRLARELHDSIGQSLVALQLQLRQIALAAADPQATGVREDLTDAADKCNALIREVRALCHGLYPPQLESLGLVSALRGLARQSQSLTSVTVRCAEDIEACRWSAEVEIELFRIAQEALQNALRHSQARQVVLELDAEDEQLILTVTDDGVGFQPAQAGKTGLGLATMQERAVAINGKFTITSGPGHTCVSVRVPDISRPPDPLWTE